MFFLFLVYFLFFAFLAYKNFRLAVGLFIILLPAYLIRFNIGQFPTTILEVGFFSLFLIWLFKFARQDLKVIHKFFIFHFISSRSINIFFIFVAVFLVSSIIAIFTSWDFIPALGIWRAYFLEPIILFFILLGRQEQIKTKQLAWFLILSSLSIIVYAIWQKFTGFGIATAEWTAEATRRSTAFFSSPNAVGLYLAPIFMLLPILWNKKNRWLIIFIAILMLLALYFTKSQGAWIGLVAGVIVLVFLLGYKKISVAVVFLGVVLTLIIPTMRSAVLFQDHASQNRLILWNQSWTYLTHSPTNFIFGAGLRQFYDKIQKPTYNLKRIERHIYPHNIFLNFWTEIGLFGMLSFAGMLCSLFYLTLKIRKNDLVLGFGLFVVLTVILIHGLVDVPYFKNDLAMLFWIIIAVIVNEARRSEAVWLKQ